MEKRRTPLQSARLRSKICPNSADFASYFATLASISSANRCSCLDTASSSLTLR